LCESQTISRNIYHNGSWEQYAIYQRSGLQVGTRIDGPAIIEQSDTTIPVLVGWSATVDDFGNLVMKREQRA
jgi:N-methylhydantoinase A